MYNTKKEAVLVLDAETNALRSPSKVHVICTRDGLGRAREFRQPLENRDVHDDFLSYIKGFKTFVGHNLVQYDLLEVLDRLFPGHGIRVEQIIDTLVLSRLLKYDQQGGHSIRSWGERFGIKKEGQDIETWDDMTEDMVLRCHSDTLISLKIFLKYQKYIDDQRWESSLLLEHQTAHVCGVMSQNGFGFDLEKAKEMRSDLQGLLAPIDEALGRAFPPLPVFVREVHPRKTAKGVFNMNDFRWYEGDDLSMFSGDPFSIIEFREFNAASPKQVVERLNAAGWKPTEKTKGHTEALKERPRDPDKIKKFEAVGWKVSEENLKTLPDTAPAAAKDLAKRIILQSRISDLEEWIALAEKEEDHHVIHGSFSPIGAWTHRLSHSKPNLANVPVAKRSPKDTEFEALINDFNDDMRGLWTARKGFRLVGTDADGLQMRIFAHIVNDERLIKSLIEGSKENATDIHSLHKGFLGEVCRSRDDAKTFIYAWLLGAGIQKVSEILKCSTQEAKKAVENFIQSYPSLRELKKEGIPEDARRGYFEGLDGRLVACSSEHLMLAGYLQNGEAIIMKGACVEWQAVLTSEGIPFRMVTWPHDEWQTEIPDDDDICRYVQSVQIEAIRNQSVKLQMNCPLDGSSSFGYTWKDTH